MTIKGKEKKRRVGMDENQEWDAVEVIYFVDTDRITHQLQFCLVFRGWAITVFVAVLTALVVYRVSLISIAGIIALLLFFYSECRYDSRRIVFQKRINDVEKNFLSRRITKLKKKEHIGEHVMSEGLPLFPEDYKKGEKLTYNLQKAEKLAFKRPVRLFTYTFLAIVLVVLAIIVQLHLLPNT